MNGSTGGALPLRFLVSDEIPNGLAMGVLPTVSSDRQVVGLGVCGQLRARGVTELGKALTGVVRDGASSCWTLPVSSLTCASFSSMR